MMSEKRFKYVSSLVSLSTNNVRGHVTTKEQNRKLIELCTELLQTIHISCEPDPPAIPETKTEE